MKVMIRTQDILMNIPELVPAFRELGTDMPEHIEIEGALVQSEIDDKELRVRFPEYWKAFTLMEWRLFSYLALHPDGVPRSEMYNIFRGWEMHLNELGEFKGSNVVDVHIKNIRGKFIALGNKHHFDTRRGWGFTFIETPEREHGPGTGRLLIDRLFERPKKLDEQGNLVIKEKKTIVRSRLNYVEFNYLKEMVMDEISADKIADRLRIPQDHANDAIAATDFDVYVRVRGQKDRNTKLIHNN